MKCPYCLESIKKNAVKCKHCQADLTTDEAKQKFKEVNYVSKKTIVISFLILGFFFWKLADYSDTQPIVSVNSCYSSYNGVHNNGENVLKANLKDPNSYEHIETRYEWNHAIIKFRAKNWFGGYDVQYFGFDTDASCSVLNWKITK